MLTERQARSETALSLARAVRKASAHGQCDGRCSVVRRAERVSRPDMPNSRRRRVLVVTIRSPRSSLATPVPRSPF